MERINEKQAPIVKIRNLSFSYEKKKENIKGLDCIIPPNAKVILAGANGAGKSTLLRILTGQIFLNLEYDEFDINGNGERSFDVLSDNTKKRRIIYVIVVCRVRIFPILQR